MTERFWAPLARRALIAVVSAGAVAALAGGTYLVAQPDSPPGLENKPDGAVQTEQGGEHGGTIERFHGGATEAGIQAACDIPPGVTLEGNWTHGDYVSAWAQEGTNEEQTAAAQSPCGKPADALDEAGATSTSNGKSDEPHGKSDEPHGRGGEVSAENRGGAPDGS